MSAVMVPDVAVELDFDKYPDHGLPRDQWLEVRRTGIGSSDAPAICGLSKYSSPFSIWADKRGDLALDDRDDPTLEWGRRLEQPIAEKFADDTGLHVYRSPSTLRHPEHPFMIANVDRHVDDDAVLEVKTRTGSDEDWRESPPEHVIVQGQHQLAVTGRARVHFACLLWGREYRTWTYERDEEMIGHLIDIEARFWDRVLNGDPPPIDGHQATTDALRELFSAPTLGSVVVLPDTAARLVADLRVSKRIAKDAKDDISLLENELKALMGDHEIAVFGDESSTPVVTWKAQQRARKHNCPDCAHEADPGRTFLLKKESK